jgi:hypothetical protein
MVNSILLYTDNTRNRIELFYTGAKKGMGEWKLFALLTIIHAQVGAVSTDGNIPL